MEHVGHRLKSTRSQPTTKSLTLATSFLLSRSPSLLPPVTSMFPCGNSLPRCSGNGECTGRLGCRCADGFGGSLCETALAPATAEPTAALPSDGVSVAILPTAIAAGLVLLICIACVMACVCALRRGRRRQDPTYFDDRGRPLAARRVLAAKVNKTLRSTLDLKGQKVRPDPQRRAEFDRARSETEMNKSKEERDAESIARIAMGLDDDLDATELVALKPQQQKPHEKQPHDKQPHDKQPQAKTKPSAPPADAESSASDEAFQPLAVMPESLTLDSLGTSGVTVVKRGPTEYDIAPDELNAPPMPSTASPASSPAVARRQAGSAAPARQPSSQLSSDSTNVRVATPDAQRRAAVSNAARQQPSVVVTAAAPASGPARKTTVLTSATNTPEVQRRQTAALSSAAAPLSAAEQRRLAVPSAKSSYVVPPTVDLPTVDLDMQLLAAAAPKASAVENPPAPPTPPPELLSSDDESSGLPPMPAQLDPPPFDDSVVDDDAPPPPFTDDAPPPPFADDAPPPPFTDEPPPPPFTDEPPPPFADDDTPPPFQPLDEADLV
jgi:hypothetical protein